MSRLHATAGYGVGEAPCAVVPNRVSGTLGIETVHQVVAFGKASWLSPTIPKLKGKADGLRLAKAPESYESSKRTVVSRWNNVKILPKLC